MTKQQLKMAYQNYLRSEHNSVDTFYKKPSEYKQFAEQEILARIDKVNGFDYRVVGGNCSHFTAGWCYLNKENRNVIFVYETAWRTYTLEVE